uniref:DEP domain-containing protein n=1 Tax=Phaeomonas parva TaxID=124430 RepID=A0A6U4HPQ6_9STRA|mmetsp:Transcript_37425/g.116986  ORF Transcript_37425/g.116986 Transcript_37425/m.116986 type:complete len:620 (+) Transcript_37425:241-2100(+)
MQREAAQKPASTPKATARAMSVDDMEVAAQRSDKGGTVARPPPFEETKEPPGAQFQEAHTLPQAYARNGNDPMSPNAFQTTEVKTAQTDVLCEIPGCLPHRHKRRPRLKDEGPEPKSGDSEDFGPKAIKGKRPAGEAKEAVPEAPPVRSEEPLHQLAMRMMRGMAPCSVYTRHMLTRRTITDVVLGEDVILWLIGDDKHPEVTDTASAIMLGQQLLDGDYMRRLSRRGFVPRLDHLRKGKNVFRGGRAIFEFVVENCSRFLLHVVPVGCHGGVRLDEASRYLTLTLGRQKQMTEIVERGTLKEGKGLRLQRFVFGVNDPDAEHLQVEGYVYRFGRGDKFMGTAQASLSRLDILGGNSDSTASRIERWQNSLSQSAENRRRSHRAQAAARPMSGRLERLQALFVDPVAGLRREGIPEGQLPDFEVDPRDPDLAPPVYYPFRARDGGPGHGALSIGMCMKLERVDHKRRGGAAHGDPGRFGFDRNLRLHAHIFEVKGVSERGTKPMFMRLGQAMGIRYNVKVRAVTKNGDIETDYTSKSPRGDAAWPVLKTGDPEGELLELELKHCNRNIDCVNFMVIQKLPTDTELSSIILASLEVRLKDIPIVEDTSLDETMVSLFLHP